MPNATTDPSLLSTTNSTWSSSKGPKNMCVYVCVCVKESIQSCSNGEVQHSCAPAATVNHEFSVRPCRGAALMGRQSPLAYDGSCPFNLTMVHQDTHRMCMCPTSPHKPFPCVPRDGGGGGTKQPPLGPRPWSNTSPRPEQGLEAVPLGLVTRCKGVVHPNFS